MWVHSPTATQGSLFCCYVEEVHRNRKAKRRRCVGIANCKESYLPRREAHFFRITLQGR